MSTRKIRVINEFHNTAINVIADESFSGDSIMAELENRAVGGDTAARARLSRIRRILCGCTDCMCSGMNHEEVAK